MAKQFLTPTGLLSLNTDPVGTLGAIYYNIAEDAIKVYNGTTWNPVGSSSTTIMIDGGSASSTYLEAYDGGDASGS
jgi:hypothetical protein